MLLATRLALALGYAIAQSIAHPVFVIWKATHRFVKKRVKTSFSPISTDWLCLQHAQTPRTRDLAIFMLTTTDGQTDCFTPCACARGNYATASASTSLESQEA